MIKSRNLSEQISLQPVSNIPGNCHLSAELSLAIAFKTTINNKNEKSSVFFGLPDVGARGFAIPADDDWRWVWQMLLNPYRMYYSMYVLVL